MGMVQSGKKDAEGQRTSEALVQTEAPSTEKRSKESRRNPKKTDGGNTQAPTRRSSKGEEIIIAVRPDLLRQLKQEESEVAPLSPTARTSVSTLADSVSSRCSSRCVTPHSIVSGPMKDMGEERRKKIRSMVRSLE